MASSRCAARYCSASRSWPRRRRAALARSTCQTSSPTINGIRAISEHSSHSISPRAAWCTRAIPVPTMITATTGQDAARGQSVMPYMKAKLAQTRWKGIVSAPGNRYINSVFAEANTGQAAAMADLARESIAHIAHRFDEKGCQLRAQPADVDVHHVRAGVELESPHVGEHLLARAHRAASLDQVADEVELAWDSAVCTSSSTSSWRVRSRYPCAPSGILEWSPLAGAPVSRSRSRTRATSSALTNGLDR